MSFFGALVEPVAALGGKVVGAWSANREGKRRIVAQRLENQAVEEKAASDFRVAEFRAKADRLTKKDDHAFTLDELAVKEAAKTWWDEFLALAWLVVTTYYPIAIYPIILWASGGAIPEPSVIFEAMGDIPWQVWAVDFGIMARYLGLRGWFRDLNIAGKFSSAKNKAASLLGKGKE